MSSAGVVPPKRQGDEPEPDREKKIARRESPQAQLTEEPMSSSSTTDRPIIVGIESHTESLGTTLLNELRDCLGEDEFAFFNLYAEIINIVPGGYEEYFSLNRDERHIFTRQAALIISKNCRETRRCGIVTGCPGPYSILETPCDSTNQKMIIFTHAVYLCQSSREENARENIFWAIEANRPEKKFQDSIGFRVRWLRKYCKKNSILFSVVSKRMGDNQNVFLVNALKMINEARIYDKDFDRIVLRRTLDKAIKAEKGHLETALVLDADKILASEKADLLFFNTLSMDQTYYSESFLKDLFGGPQEYSYTALCQRSWIYEDIATTFNTEVDTIYSQTAAALKLRPEVLSLIKLLVKKDYIHVILTTYVPRQIWERVLKREGLSHGITIVGGGRVSDKIIMTPALKSSMVSNLRTKHNLRVWAFGDSILDLDILCKADRAVIFVEAPSTWTQAASSQLVEAISKGFRAQQFLLPNTLTPLLDTAKLPVVQITGVDFIKSVLAHPISFTHGTGKPAAKLFESLIRDTSAPGPSFHELLRKVGYYLATEYVTAFVGLMNSPITGVGDPGITSSCLASESETLILGLCGGGEIMAYGVHDAFPKATFRFALKVNDMTLDYFNNYKTVILVDLAMEVGQIIIGLVRGIKALRSDATVVAVVCAAQTEVTSCGGILDQELGGLSGFHLIALSVSEKNFAGRPL